jgi:hypothetical protein
MKLTDWIVDKFGADKVMHYLVGAWVPAVLSPMGWLWVILGGVSVILLNILKERYLDNEFEIKDIYSAGFGSLTSTVLYGLINTI